MRLRLNLSGTDLAYHFQVSNSNFFECHNVLYVKLKHLIIWPERDALFKTMPILDFRKHCPRYVVIINCFDIFLERPTNLLARAQTFSSYKHQITIKYLISVIPQGTVSSISERLGGDVSEQTNSW